MKKETIIWLIVFLLGAAALVWRANSGSGMGKAYMKSESMRFVNVGSADDPNWVNYDSRDILDFDAAQTPYADFPADQRIEWTKWSEASQRDYVDAKKKNSAQTDIGFNFWRTAGVWVAAFFTLAIFSFLYRDNALYKIAEAVVVGVSAAYWMVVGFWTVIVPNLIGKIWPMLVKGWAMPGLSGEDLVPNYWFLATLVLGIMLLMRLSPKGAWISRWPLAFIIGTTAGIRLVGFIQADFLSQIRNSIVPLYAEAARHAADGTVMLDTAGNPVTGFSIWDSLRHIILVVGVLSCLVYFFFSFEHKGFVGQTARLGIWFLMITFGAAFGYTVMGRIALLSIRIEFLVDDWLWLIDPTNKRVEEAVALLGMLGVT